MELKICISPQFRAIDPPNPARGFIQQNENVRFATAACMQKYGNVSFATVACAKCMRYGGRGGGPIPWGGGGGQHGTRNHIYILLRIYIRAIYTRCTGTCIKQCCNYIFIHIICTHSGCMTIVFLLKRQVLATVCVYMYVCVCDIA